MLEEANFAFNIFSAVAFFNDQDLIEIKKSYVGRVSVKVHPSFYRALKLTFPLDIGGLSTNGSITTEMTVGSMGTAVGVLTPLCLFRNLNLKLPKWPWD